MQSFQRISVEQAKELLQQVETRVVDIRDEVSFANGHIENAIHLSNHNVQQFLAEIEEETPVIVVCYHGHSSQQAAQFLAEQGCKATFSMDGGMEAWAFNNPTVAGSE